MQYQLLQQQPSSNSHIGSNPCISTAGKQQDRHITSHPATTPVLTSANSNGQRASSLKQHCACYAVRKGRIPGIYNVWEEAKRQVEGYSQNEYEGFHTEVEALQYLVGTVTTLPAVESQGPAEKQQVPTYQSVNMYEVLPTRTNVISSRTDV